MQTDDSSLSDHTLPAFTSVITLKLVLPRLQVHTSLPGLPVAHVESSPAVAECRAHLGVGM